MDLQDPHVLLSKFIYIQTIKLLQIDHYHSGFFNPTLPSAQQGMVWNISKPLNLNLNSQVIAAISMIIIFAYFYFTSDYLSLCQPFILNYNVHITFRNVTEFKLPKLQLVKTWGKVRGLFVFVFVFWLVVCFWPSHDQTKI